MNVWLEGDTLIRSRKLGLFYGDKLHGHADTFVCRLLDEFMELVQQTWAIFHLRLVWCQQVAFGCGGGLKIYVVNFMCLTVDQDFALDDVSEKCRHCGVLHKRLGNFRINLQVRLPSLVFSRFAILLFWKESSTSRMGSVLKALTIFRSYWIGSIPSSFKEHCITYLTTSSSS